jgi:hypothetical protein
MLQQVVEKFEGSVSVNPTVRNEVDDADLMSVNSISPLNEKIGDAGTELLEDGTEKRVEENKVETKIEEAATSKKAEEVKAGVVTPDPVKKSLVQKRIDELTRKRHDAEQLAASERAKRVELEAELQRLKSTTTPTSEPKVEDFETEAEYLKALVDWRTDARTRSNREGEIAKAKETSVGAEVVAEREVVKAVMEKGKEKFSDFDEKVFNKDLVLSPAVVRTVMAADKADEVIYYLATNPEESKLLSGMSGNRLAIEIGRIEERLSQPAPAAPPKKTTNAPPPITPVRTTGATEKDPSQMTPKEYRAWRERNKE